MMDVVRRGGWAMVVASGRDTRWVLFLLLHLSSGSFKGRMLERLKL